MHAAICHTGILYILVLLFNMYVEIYSTYSKSRYYIQAIQKGNMDGARIHAENSIRQKNQVMYMLYLTCLTILNKH